MELLVLVKGTVRVTAKDIKAGKQRSTKQCPLALALYRKTGKHWQVVGAVADWRDRRIRIIGGGAFVDQFDSPNGGPLPKPQSFKFEEVV